MQLFLFLAEVPIVVLSNVLAVATFPFLSLGFLAGKRSLSLMLLESEKHGDLANGHAPASCGRSGIPGRCRGFHVRTWPPHHQWPWLSPVLQKAATAAATWCQSAHCGRGIFFLQDKQLELLSQTLFREVPFGQRAHYLRVITHEYRTESRHFQELPNKLIKEPGCGLR